MFISSVGPFIDTTNTSVKEIGNTLKALATAIHTLHGKGTSGYTGWRKTSSSGGSLGECFFSYPQVSGDANHESS